MHIKLQIPVTKTHKQSCIWVKKMTPLTLVTVDFIMIIYRNAKPKELLISAEYKFQAPIKMFAVMAFYFDHKKLYNSTFVFDFFSESRKFHVMAIAFPDAIKSAERQISKTLSSFRFD